MSVQSLFQNVLCFLFPNYCMGCNALLVNGTSPIEKGFCSLCAQSVLEMPIHCCPRCSEPYENASKSHLCVPCLKDPPAFDAVYTNYVYGGALAKALHRYKYGKKSHLSRRLSDLFYDLSTKQFDVVIPIPLHPNRLAERGFNQSALLAKDIAKKWTIPLKTDVLFRCRDGISQVGKTKRAHLQNRLRFYPGLPLK